MSELNGGTGENENRLRLDRMNDVIQGMIALTLEQGKMYDRQHEQVMTEIKAQRAENAERHAQFMKTLREQHAVFTEEVRDLIELQKEQRIDIMALFAGAKQLREAWAEYLKREKSERPV
jgi:translation elongation factor EF-Tu-like GTPase